VTYYLLKKNFLLTLGGSKLVKNDFVFKVLKNKTLQKIKFTQIENEKLSLSLAEKIKQKYLEYFKDSSFLNIPVFYYHIIYIDKRKYIYFVEKLPQIFLPFPLCFPCRRQRSKPCVASKEAKP